MAKFLAAPLDFASAVFALEDFRGKPRFGSSSALFFACGIAAGRPWRNFGVRIRAKVPFMTDPALRDPDDRRYALFVEPGAGHAPLPERVA